MNTKSIERFTPERIREELATGRNVILTHLSQAELLQRAGLIRAGAFDFDGTLAISSQWKEINKFLPPDLVEEDEADLHWYFNWVASEDQNGHGLDDPDWFIATSVHDNRTAVEGAWIARSLARFVRGNLCHEHVVSAARALTLRVGASELLQLFDHRVVISMGIENVIRACLDHKGLNSAVAASRLTFTDDGIVNGYDRNVVVSSSKAAAHQRFVKLCKLAIDQHLVIGDSVIDVEMMPERAFNVWIVPHAEEISGLASFRDRHLADMLPKLTMVLGGDSLLPLVQLIREARASV